MQRCPIAAPMSGRRDQLLRMRQRGIQWQALSGQGEVYSFTVIRQVVGRAASKAFENDIPYVIAWIDLDEGPRMITNVIGCPVEDVNTRHESVGRIRTTIAGYLAAEVQASLVLSLRSLPTVNDWDFFHHGEHEGHGRRRELSLSR